MKNRSFIAKLLVKVRHRFSIGLATLVMVRHRFGRTNKIEVRSFTKHLRAKTRVALSMRPKYPRWSKWIISLDTDSTIQDLELFNYIVKKTWVSQKMVVLENCNFKKSGFVVRFLRVFSYNTMMIYRVFQPTCFFLLFMPFWALLDLLRPICDQNLD